MFDSKKTSLFETPPKRRKASDQSAFVSTALKKGAETRSGNGAKKYSTTGMPFVDQFGILGSYKQPRAYHEIVRDCELLWAEDPLKCVQFILYSRMISRKTNTFEGNTTVEPQRGAELKHEGVMRMLWLHNKSKDTFWKNIGLFIAVGSWKDVFTMLRYDLTHHGWDKKVLDWNRFSALIRGGLNSEQNVDLIKKYLPQIKAKSSCKTVDSQANTMIGKWLCMELFGEEGSKLSQYKRYRKLKSSGTAHQWQQLISQRKFDAIEFDQIHGRALSLLVKSKFLNNHGLSEKYNDWINDDSTTDVKYTGFVHELFQGLGRSKNQAETVNKQFKTLVDKAKSKEMDSRLIVVRDTSASMGSTAKGTKMSCYDIAKALALYFSEFLTGRFQDAWIEFNSTAKMHEWKGRTPVDRWFNDRSSYIGSTNFQSVIDLFVNLKHQGVPESEFPTGILCISDGEFNPAHLGKTNVNAALSKLRRGGFSDSYVNNFVIALWNLQSRYYGSNTGKKFETYGDVQNVFYFSGYSASTVAFLTSEIKTASELFDAAMSQEILQMVEL